MGIDQYQVGGVDRYLFGIVDRCRVGGVDRCLPLVKFPDLFPKCADRHQAYSLSYDPNIHIVLHPILFSNPLALKNLPW